MIVLTLARNLFAAVDRAMAALHHYRDLAQRAETARNAEALRRRMGLDA